MENLSACGAGEGMISQLFIIMLDTEKFAVRLNARMFAFSFGIFKTAIPNKELDENIKDEKEEEVEEDFTSKIKLKFVNDHNSKGCARENVPSRTAINQYRSAVTTPADYDYTSK
ncbi:hypothetical protein T4D_5285 [Trichinella pseudospiralis]|uniref:Uncharacterized protein n=1 Tax=Trichinella pseudospiralis TaxID=6337 RepID=A0A0V1FWK7_TRIPS|nr:hypothetical protein T4D_5285 [Trichinella pseudospiralis]